MKSALKFSKGLKNMMREQLEHIIRSASTIANDYEIVVVGSQSILGGHPHAPAALLFSMEADVYPKNQKEKSDLIDGAIGEGSAFHVSYGYYAQGVGPETAVLLSDWESRLSAIRLTNSVGYCLDVYDLAISKLAANREKDHKFVSLLLSGINYPQLLLFLIHNRSRILHKFFAKEFLLWN